MQPFASLILWADMLVSEHSNGATDTFNKKGPKTPFWDKKKGGHLIWEAVGTF